MVLSAQKIIFQNIEHDVNNDVLKMDVMLKNRTNGSPVVDVDAVLFQDLDEPIFVSFDSQNLCRTNVFRHHFPFSCIHFVFFPSSQINNIISKRVSPTDYQPLLKTGRINMCDFLKKPDREPFLKMLIDTVTKYGALIFQCPVKQGDYHLKDFELEASSLPSFTPPGDYRVDFTISQKENDVFSMVWFAKVSD